MKDMIFSGDAKPLSMCKICGRNEVYFADDRCENCTICKVCTSEFTLSFRHGDIVEMKCQKCNAYFEIILT